MSERVVAKAEIRNKLGLHARPAMSFVDVANQFSASVTVARLPAEGEATQSSCGAEGVDGKSIMQMMMLAATKGTVLEITAEGPDAAAAVKALRGLVESGFDEE